ncbi:MAG: CRISPR-associated protein [Blastocatellia bacterium AA13]|nr:MAG: CRISPR-associated protein [Blastocatellia bacterium AA13]
MHRKLLNEARLSLSLTVQGPLLVKSGTENWDPSIPDMQFIRTLRGDGRETVFIPGSSLKGTLRSYTEKIARTLNVSCCDPFEERGRDQSCGKKLDAAAKQSDSFAIYRGSCVACRIYGSTTLAGRAQFADSYPTADLSPNLTRRTAVAIDRILGSVSAGPFEFEALMAGTFRTEIRLTNFELWQIGLIGFAIRDLCLGRIKIGYGKSRGLGDVNATLDALELRSITSDGIQQANGKLSIKGIGALLNEKERESYGIAASEIPPATIDSPIAPKPELIGSSIEFRRAAEGEDWAAREAALLFNACIDKSWTSYRDANQVGAPPR